MALLVSHEVGKGLNFEQCGNNIYNVRGFGKGIAFSMHYAFTIRIVESNGNKQSGKRKALWEAEMEFVHSNICYHFQGAIRE